MADAFAHLSPLLASRTPMPPGVCGRNCCPARPSRESRCIRGALCLTALLCESLAGGTRSACSHSPAWFPPSPNPSLAATSLPLKLEASAHASSGVSEPSPACLQRASSCSSNPQRAAVAHWLSSLATETGSFSDTSPRPRSAGDCASALASPLLKTFTILCPGLLEVGALGRPIFFPLTTALVSSIAF